MLNYIIFGAKLYITRLVLRQLNQVQVHLASSSSSSSSSSSASVNFIPRNSHFTQWMLTLLFSRRPDCPNLPSRSSPSPQSSRSFDPPRTTSTRNPTREGAPFPTASLPLPLMSSTSPSASSAAS